MPHPIYFYSYPFCLDSLENKIISCPIDDIKRTNSHGVINEATRVDKDDIMMVDTMTAMIIIILKCKPVRAKHIFLVTSKNS